MADDTNKALDDLLAAIAARRQSGSIRPAEKSSFRDVIADGVSNGLLMGYGDEARSWVGANVLGKGNYDDLLTQERDRLATVRAERPFQTGAAEVAGSLAPLLLTGGASAPVSGTAAAARSVGLLGQIGQGAFRGLGAGALGGAVQGFGEGEGGLSARLDKAVEGGLYGAAGGAVLGGAVPAVAAAARHLATPVDARARDTVLRALDADGLTPEQVAREYQARNAGPNAKPELISDLYPQSNVSTRLEGALNQPGRDRGTIVGAILGRGDDQGDRILTDFERVFGSRQGQFDATFKGLDAARRTDARPLYGEAYNHYLADHLEREMRQFPPAVGDELSDILARIPDRAMTHAREQARMGGDAMADGPIFGRVRDEGGQHFNTVLNRVPSVRELDYLKRGLDRMIELDTDHLTRRVGSEGYAANQVKQQLIQWLDHATTVVDPQTGASRSLYGEARAAWAGPSAMMDAMQHGQAALRDRAEITVDRVAEMSRSEKDAFLVGVLDAVQQRLGQIRVDRDASGAIGMSANSRRAIQAAMSAVTDDPRQQQALAARLVDQIEREVQIARTTRDLTGNSRTALRLAEQQSERRGDGVLRAMAGEALTAPLGMPGMATMMTGGGRLMRGGLERAAQTAETARQGEVARLLSGQDVHSVTNAMRSVADRRDSLEALLRRRTLTDPTIAGFAGGRALSGQVVQPNYSRLPTRGLLDRLR